MSGTTCMAAFTLLAFLACAAQLQGAVLRGQAGDAAPPQLKPRNTNGVQCEDGGCGFQFSDGKGYTGYTGYHASTTADAGYGNSLSYGYSGYYGQYGYGYGYGYGDSSSFGYVSTTDGNSLSYGYSGYYGLYGYGYGYGLYAYGYGYGYGDSNNSGYGAGYGT